MSFLFGGAGANKDRNVTAVNQLTDVNSGISSDSTNFMNNIGKNDVMLKAHFGDEKSDGKDLYGEVAFDNAEVYRYCAYLLYKSPEKEKYKKKYGIGDGAIMKMSNEIGMKINARQNEIEDQALTDPFILKKLKKLGKVADADNLFP